MTDRHLPVVAVDWSWRRLHVTRDGVDVEVLDGVEELLASLDRPHRIVTEATFESWDADRKADRVAQIRAAGHQLEVFRPIHTDRNRPEEWPKTDSNDAKVIHLLATGGRLHTYPLPDPDPDWETFRDLCNRDYHRLRMTGDKVLLVDAVADLLGPYRTLEGDRRLVLGNGKKYSPSLVAATYFAASRSTNRATFERLLGLHGSAYPSLLRSEVHHHGFRWARRRGADWPTFRRVLRGVFREVKAARDAAPEAAAA